eukprot:scaffold207_cov409-Prasinococcus_capsulatus_cf.AAC.27
MERQTRIASMEGARSMRAPNSQRPSGCGMFATPELLYNAWMSLRVPLAGLGPRAGLGQRPYTRRWGRSPLWPCLVSMGYVVNSHERVPVLHRVARACAPVRSPSLRHGGVTSAYDGGGRIVCV